MVKEQHQYTMYLSHDKTTWKCLYQPPHVNDKGVLRGTKSHDDYTGRV